MPHHRHGRHKSGSQNEDVITGDVAAAVQLQGATAATGRQNGARMGAGHASSVVDCCLPSGCCHNTPIHINDPGDAVKVMCNNDTCTVSAWMHGECFQEWEQHVLAYLRSCGRARSWSEKQRLQNLWTKKGYDLAYKACDCKCGRGHIRKDLDYFPQLPRPEVQDKKQKKPKKKNEKPLPMSVVLSKGPSSVMNVGSGPLMNHGIHSVAHMMANMNTGPLNGRPQLRVRTSSFSSTGSSGSPPSSAGTPPLTPGRKNTKFDFFQDIDQAAAGNIFRRRTDFSVFNVLPRHQQNPYHIKMEDEGPHGNDETRCFVLTNLSTHQMTTAQCVVCNVELPVFDKYPLIDGTFFLSPQRYNTTLQVLSEEKMLYLNAVCMKCLSGKCAELRCIACRTPWNGLPFVIGSMYSYDIFAAIPCCAQRLSCKNCRRGILDPGCAFQFFSEYSKPIQCPHCHIEDYHFIKPLQGSFTMKHMKQPIRN